MAIQERKHQNNLASMIKSKGPPPALTIKGVYEYAPTKTCTFSMSMRQAASPIVPQDVHMWALVSILRSMSGELSSSAKWLHLGGTQNLWLCGA